MRPYFPSSRWTGGHRMTVYTWARPRRFPRLPAPVVRYFDVADNARVLALCHWQPRPWEAPTLLALHGLEGSADAHYMRGLADKARETLELAPPVALNQWDIRELQLAKGAIAAGLRILMDQWGTSHHELQEVYLAGAFGNYINYASARRIGLIDFPLEKVRPVGNTTLLGAKLALFTFDRQNPAYPELLKQVKHVSLHEDPRFQETYVEEMTFPDIEPRTLNVQR